MFGQVWHHDALRSYVVYFGNMFSDVYLQREDVAGNTVQTMRVPLGYGPKEKFLARLEGNPVLDRPIAIQLPRMSFEMTNFVYDASRKLQLLGRPTNLVASDPNMKYFQYNPVPYNIDFSLYIMVKNASDGTRIIEQILPFFTPEWTASLNVNPDLNVKYDVPIIFNNIVKEDTYEGSFEERRTQIWTLTFTMKAWLFGPTRTGSIIKKAEININIPPMSVSIDDADSMNTSNTAHINVYPGQDANGAAVNYYGSSNNVPAGLVDWNLISSDDTYGFIVDFTENL